MQRDGGKAIGLTNEMYEKAGATIVDTPEEIFARADMIRTQLAALGIALEDGRDGTTWRLTK